MNQSQRMQKQGQLLQAMGRVGHLIDNRLDGALGEQGLSIAKMGVLRELSNAGEPLPLGQLAERLSCVRSNITQLVDRLEAEGLVQRVPDPGDRRSMRAAVTEQGRLLYQLGSKIQTEVEAELFKGLSHDEQAALTRLLEKFGQ